MLKGYIVMKIQLKRERDQLLHTWARYFKHHDNWFTNEFTQINKIIYLSKTDPELYFTIGRARPKRGAIIGYSAERSTG